MWREWDLWDPVSEKEMYKTKKPLFLQVSGGISNLRKNGNEKQQARSRLRPLPLWVFVCMCLPKRDSSLCTSVQRWDSGEWWSLRTGFVGGKRRVESQWI